MNDDSVSPPSGSRRARGIYLIPNLFTTGALFFGFFAIVSAMGKNFEPAAIAIFVAMVLDSLDGKIARLTHTQTAFGAEYDSLSDMVSFGVAPALIVYEWSLHNLGKLGWFVAFLYTATAALRLARFNTQLGVADKRYFQGLPSPAAAAIVTGLVWVGVDHNLTGTLPLFTAVTITIIASLLMVSNIRYNSLKDPDLLRGKVPFVALLLMVVTFVTIAIQPPQMLFAGFLLYAISGPVLTLIHLRQRRIFRRHQPPSDNNSAGEKPN